MSSQHRSIVNSRLLSPDETPIINGNFRIPTPYLYKSMKESVVFDALLEVLFGEQIPEAVIGHIHKAAYDSKNRATRFSIEDVPGTVVLADELYYLPHEKQDPFIRMGLSKRNRLSEELAPGESKLRTYHLEEPLPRELATFFRDWTMRYVNMMIEQEYRF